MKLHFSTKPLFVLLVPITSSCSNMCHESSGKGLGQTIGIGKGTVSLDDFLHADTIRHWKKTPEQITPAC